LRKANLCRVSLASSNGPAVQSFPMQPRSTRSLALSTLLCLSLTTHAEVPSQTAESLMHKSGLWQQLGAVAPQVRAGFVASAERSPKPPSASEMARVLKVFEHAYSPARLRAASLLVLAKNLDAQRVPEVEHWLDSPLGVKVSQMEAAASADTTAQEAQVNEGAALLRNMPRARREVFTEFIAVTRTAELLAELAIETTVASVQGLASATPDAQPVSPAELRQALDARKPQLEAAMAAQAMLAYARSYAALPTEDLKRYVQFLKTAAGSHFNAVGFAAFMEALKEGAAESGRRLPGAKDDSNT
jgi:hypothetical protein